VKETFVRIYVIARNTLTEALRQKVLNLLLLFAVITIGSANFFTQFTFDEQLKFLKDFSLGAMTFFGVLIAVMGTAQLIPSELESRTIYTILSKPVRRFDFLLGKFMGMIALLGIFLLLMTLVFAAVLLLKEQALIASETAFAQGQNLEPGALEHSLRDIRAQARDPQLVQAVLLVYAKLCMTAGLALFVSTFATSTIFTVATAFLLYLAGHLQATAREAWLEAGASAGLGQQIFLGAVSLLIPDMASYGVVDEIILGHSLPWNQTAGILGYTAVYLTVLLAVSYLIFHDREL
jgi:ABC-type Na+ efflux pump permease subunit